MKLENTISLNCSEVELLQIYNHIPKALFHQVISVVVDLQTLSNPESVLFKQEKHGNYWIINKTGQIGLLLPKGERRINSHDYPIIELIFDCEGYLPEENQEFTVKKPAQVSLATNENEWRLEAKGMLEFGKSHTLAQLKSLLEQADDEYKNLQAQLEQSEKARQEIEQQFQQSENERQKLIALSENLQKENQNLITVLEETKQENGKLQSQQVKSPSLDEIKNAVKEILSPVSQNKAEDMPDTIQQFIIDELQKNNTFLLNQLTLLINKPSTQEFRQEEPSETQRQKKQEAEKSPSDAIVLTEEEKSVLHNYNVRTDLSQWTTSVSTTKDSELSARAGSGKLTVLTEDTMGTYWLVTEREGLYLVLNHTKKLNSLQMDSVGELFELRNYPQKNNDPNHFKLLKPGKLSVGSDSKTWELIEKGVLDFSLDSL